ncbi:hypothetical protein JXA88_19455, partial [Candidatus Fermentibacteria bacterium]|nr:hypothetical protein [Candidatus Fermentibacteria bacterium]
GVFLNGTAIRVRGPANVSPDIIVQGTYAGNWLLISQRHIVLIGDLMPAHDPRFGPSDDIMGLIPAEQAQGLRGKMKIPDLIPGYPTGIDGDRQLCAFVLVPYREGTWEVVNFSTRAREGILLLMGGVGFGCIGPTETSDFLHGYGTDIWYDGRACEKGTPPPCFPEMVSEQGNRPVWNVAQMDSSWREIY